MIFIVAAVGLLIEFGSKFFLQEPLYDKNRIYRLLSRYDANKLDENGQPTSINTFVKSIQKKNIMLSPTLLNYICHRWHINDLPNDKKYTFVLFPTDTANTVTWHDPIIGKDEDDHDIFIMDEEPSNEPNYYKKGLVVGDYVIFGTDTTPTVSMTEYEESSPLILVFELLKK